MENSEMTFTKFFSGKAKFVNAVTIDVKTIVTQKKIIKIESIKDFGR